jgi:hypothetical protein
MAVVIGFAIWWSTSHQWFPEWVDAALVLFGAAVTALLVLLIFLTSTNLGMTIDEGGFVVFERSISRRKAIRREIQWNELRGAGFPGSIPSGEILLKTDGPSVSVSYAQARRILLHPCCRLKEKISPAVAIRVGLHSGPG